MTEAEWLACDDPGLLFRDASWTPGDRKSRLFCLACCERIRQFIADPRSTAAVEFLEQHVEIPHNRRKGIVGVRTAAKQAHTDAYMEMFREPDPVERARKLAVSNAANAAHDILDRNPRWAGEYTAAFAVHAVAWDWLVKHRPEQLPDYPREVGDPERRQQVRLLHDVFGNPFRPVAFEPAWRTANAVAIARQMYESREFAAMPILADALEDAGCENGDVLGHCRDAEQVHVRGCWVVDLVLGKV
jgi:hypothetical protein